MRAGRAKRQKLDEQKDKETLWDAVQPQPARNVSQKAYGTDLKFQRGGQGSQIETDIVMLGGEPCAQGNKSDRSSARLKRRGVVSHAAAHAQALKRRCSNARLALVVQSFDDANMWVQRHDQAAKNDSTSKGRRRKGARNRHAPVLSTVAHLITEDDSPPVACQVHSPSQVLPKANWATLNDRLGRVSVQPGIGVGKKLREAADDDSMSSMFDNCSYTCYALCKDSLITNQCVVGNLQKELERNKINGRISTFIDVNCLHHKACLCTKPVIQRIDAGRFATVLTRVGHLQESSTFMSRFLEALDAIVDQSYKHREVDTYPLVIDDEGRQVDLDVFARERTNFLDISRAAQDLNEEEVKQIVLFDNGDPKSDDLVHYHHKDRCTVCTDAATGKQHMKSLVRKQLGSGSVVPLLYRFKHFHLANAYSLRGSHSHNLLRRAFQEMYPEKARKKAAAEAAQAAGAAGEISLALKQALRASSVLDYFTEQPVAKFTLQASVLSTPLQAYMDMASEADRLCIKLLDAMQVGRAWPLDRTDSRDADPDRDMAELEARTFELNVLFITGKLGKGVLMQYIGLLGDFASDDWQGYMANWSETDSPEILDQVVMAMAETWRRLVAAFNTPGSQHILDACHDGGKFRYDSDAIREGVNKMIGIQMACSGCLAGDFVEPLLPALDNPASRETAVAFIRRVVTVLRVSSSVVERHHLIGQEAKPGKARGAAMQPATLQSHTYRGSGLQEAVRINASVRKDVFEQYGLSEKQFHLSCPRKWFSMFFHFGFWG